MAVKITANGIDTVQDNTVDASKIVDSNISPADLPAGTALQTVRVYNGTRSSYTTTTSDTVHPGTTITVTPKASNSKFLIQARQFCELDGSWDVSWNVQRNGSRINVNGLTNQWSGMMMSRQSYANAANDNSSTPDIMVLETLDTSGSTAGTDIVYRLTTRSSSNRTSWVNCTWNNDPQNGHETGTSEVIITEYKG